MKLKKIASDRWKSTDGRVEVIATRERRWAGGMYRYSHSGRRYVYRVCHRAYMGGRLVAEACGIRRLMKKLGGEP